MPAPGDGALKPLGRPRLVLLVLVGLLALGAPFLLRKLFIERVVRDSLFVLRGISAGLPQSGSGVEAEDFTPLFPLWPGEVEEAPHVAAPEPEASVAPTPPQAQRKPPAPYRPVVGPAPQSARASQELVLHWVEARMVPTGVTRPQTGTIPSGIELRGVAGLGVGLMDGDRLVRVDGVEVVSRGHVVGAVLGARSRMAPAVVASLVRMTKDGPQSFTVTVEQPYLPATSESSPPDRSSDLEPERQSRRRSSAHNERSHRFVPRVERRDEEGTLVDR